MAKGQEAKNLVIDKIKNAFGQDWIGENNKKFYVWSREDGVRQQVCITLTCPKNPVGVAEGNSTLDFTSDERMPAKETVTTEITQEERDRLETLMAKLGL